MKIEKPLVLTMEGWEKWEAEYRRDHPIRYFLREVLRLKVKRGWKRLVGLKYWVVHRTYDKYHVVRVYGMKPGYADKDYIMLHVTFGLLVDYVECECAWMNYGSKHEYQLPFRWDSLLFWKHFNSPEDGLAHLDWAGALTYNADYCVNPEDDLYGKPTGQAAAAREAKALYLWYKTRPNRPDAEEISGWYDVCRRKESGENVPEGEVRATLNICAAVESKYDQEDDEKLVQLMKIRRSLWT